MRFALVWLAVALLGGCGSSTQTQDALGVAKRFEAALADGDAQTACGLLAGAAVRRINDLRPEGCASALPTLGLPAEAPADVRVWGDTAQAKSGHDTLFLRRLPEGWRIIGAGCTPNGEAPYKCKADGT
ncbi:hypothetical protein [Actinocrispum sp. NPDC049592]|uniref:hypothetical protein n=1 Tax=Actinocrispum sp. NPDC049592 TaxID=3154835 RepID=UPI003436C155